MQERARGLQIPPLKNLPSGTMLSGYLVPNAVVPDSFSDSVLPNGEWVDALLRQLAEIHGRARQLHYAGLSAILALQEQVAGQWRAAVASPQGQRF